MKIRFRKVTNDVPKDEEFDELLRKAEEIATEFMEMKKEYIKERRMILRNAWKTAIKTRNIRLLIETYAMIGMRDAFYGMNRFSIFNNYHIL